ncbi:MAG: amidohydrolase [Desulfovibrionaceae bacterium]|nr:amidohydrolase [Desulfovibrionaceae bacterium]
MQTCDLILNAPYIVTQDEERHILKSHALAIAKDKIIGIGPSEQICTNFQPKFTYDLKDCMILPGLINAHTHVAMTFLRGFADDLPLMQWLQTKIFPIEAKLSSEIVRLATRLGLAEMLRTGTTSCLDMYLFEQDILAEAQMVGFRLGAGEGVFMFPSCSSANYQTALDITKSMAKSVQEPCQVFVAPHSIYTTTKDILAQCLDVAKSEKLPLHIHLAETKSETEQAQTNWQMRPIPYSKELGLLDHPSTLAHVVDVDAADLEILAASKNAVVVHNPSSNLKLASGLAKIPQMLELNIPVALGTDGAASNNQLNMFAEMRLAALIHKVSAEDPTVLPAQTVLDLATINGAKALHNPQIGSLKVGFKADLIALDLTCPNMQPMFKPTSQIVYAASGHEVCFTMVNGKILYDHGEFTTIDYDDLLEEVEDIKSFVLKSI